MVCNPPYGERLGDESSLILLYQELGHILYQHYQGWQSAILTKSPLLAKSTGLRASKQYTLYNGAMECKLYLVSLDANQVHKDREHDSPLSEGAEMFKNRLLKNKKHLQKWAERMQIDCYRVYDADLPEYAYAIDIYGDQAVLQEYAPPASIEAHIALQRRLDVYQVAPIVLQIPKNKLVVKQRLQQKGANQYQKMNQKEHAMIVNEGDVKFKVNLYDYLDTGLFLDHRPLRLTFRKCPPNTRFLNCFCYTATASVHAAKGGALTTNVDLSKTYLNWAEENFILNAIDLSKHQFIQEDCLIWLKTTRDRFDVIFLDPPSFSNSKRMKDTLDIQRDHEGLIRAAMKLLYPGGTLYFSTNLRYFKLSERVMKDYTVRDITAQTIDVDFKRNKRIHHCFTIKNESHQ